MSVGVVAHFKFAPPNARKYSSYIRYMARDEASRAAVYREESNFAFDQLKKKDYEAYNYYMSNPEKASGLFDNTSNHLSQEGIKALQKQFQKAHQAESNMWQIVVSFDNQWLEKFGAYEPGKHKLDEVLVMNAARRGINEVLKTAHMEQAVWSGAVHYNTDNIHIHFAVVEPIPTKAKRWYQDKETGKWKYERPGYLPYQAIRRLKSQVANTIADRVQEHRKFDDLIREQVGNRENLKYRLRASFHLQKLYQQLYQVLPDDKRLWRYNNNAMAAFRPQIDAISQYYIDHFKSKEFQELKERLSLEKDFIKETYGESQKMKSRAEDYETAKLHELYSQLGNTILKDLIRYDRQLKGQRQTSTQVIPFQSQSLSINLYALKRTFQKTREELLRQREFERLQREMEQEI